MTKSIAIGLLTLAVTTSLTLAQDKPAAGGWTAKPGSGLKYDGGDDFSFRLVNQLQIHFVSENNENTPDENNFRVRRARTTLSGHAFDKNILYYLMFDAVDSGSSGDGNIKQGHVTWNFMNSDSGTIGLRVGQAKVLFGLEGTGSSTGLTFAERSSAARTFSDDYSRGAWLLGRYAESKLRWTLGAVNSTTLGEEASNDGDKLAYVASVNFDPLGDFFDGKQTTESFRQGDFREGERELRGTVGLGYAMDNTVGAGSAEDVETTTLNFNTAWSVQGFQVIGEWFDNSVEQTGAADQDSDGIAVAANYVLDKNADSSIQWGFGLRYSVVDASDAGGDEVTDISAVVNAFYHGHACKTQFELTQRDFDQADNQDLIFTVAFQLLF